MILLPRETVEFVRVPLTVDGVAVTAFDVAVTPHGTRPTSTSWAPVTVVGDARGVLISELTPGSYSVWARYTANPEKPIREMGTVEVT